MKPPLPPLAPPCALKAPPTVVVPSDHTTISPPLPVTPASALSVAPVATVLVVAWASTPCPWASPPTRIVPPPAAPLALSTAADPICRLSPSTLMVPPARPFALPTASSCPVTDTTPLEPPSSRICPPFTLMPSARITPLTFSTVSSALPAERACRLTLPSAAAMVPLWVIEACAAAASTDTPIRLSGASDTVMRLPAANAVLPPVVLMVPLLTMLGAANTTYLPTMVP